MTKDEKLKKALEALKSIANDPSIEYTRDYAKQAYILLTTPRMELIEVERWMITNPAGGVYSDTFMSKEAAECKMAKMYGPVGQIIKLTGTYQRPVEEKEPRKWIGIVQRGHDHGFLTEIPREWLGKTVEVRLKEEE